MGKAEIKYCKSLIYMHSSNMTKYNFHVIVFENVHYVHLSKINTSKCTRNLIKNDNFIYSHIILDHCTSYPKLKIPNETLQIVEISVSQKI